MVIDNVFPNGHTDLKPIMNIFVHFHQVEEVLALTFAVK